MKTALPQLSLPFAGAAAPPVGKTDGAVLDERNATAYVEMTCRSILNWAQGNRMRELFTINPYRGCEFGCAYCYARYTHEFLELGHWEDFERRIFVKANAPEIFRREIKRKDVLRHGIAIGTATDPYQPAERRFGITRRILESLLPYRDIPISIVSKSGLIERDAELLGELAKRHPVDILTSCISLDRELLRALERRAATPERRFAAMEKLSAAGVRCGIIVAPILPGLTDGVDDLTALLVRAKAAGAQFVVSQVLFLSASSKKRFFPWLKENAPWLYEQYGAAYARGVYDGEAYRDQVRRHLAEAMRRAGFDEASRRRRRVGPQAA